MRKRDFFLSLLLASAWAEHPVRSAAQIGADEEGNSIFSIAGKFSDQEKLEFEFKCHGGHFTPCLIQEETGVNVICKADLDDGKHSLFLNQELCTLDACDFNIKRPELGRLPKSSSGESGRPRSRIESGRRRSDYQEPPQKDESGKNARMGWNDTPNWPVVYDVLNGDVSINGGFMITIEGENFGSKLDSFGEEGREGNSDIKVFLEYKISGSWAAVAECIPVAHYHNPTQIFCHVFDKLPFTGKYRTKVYINGNAANWHCGCKKCDYMCQMGVWDWANDFIRQSPDSLLAAGQPTWTSWYSFEEFGSEKVYEWECEHCDQTEGQEFFWGDVWAKKNTSEICFAPLALEARNDLTGAILEPAFFDSFNRESAVCRHDEGSNGCSLNNTSFRFLCDEGATKFQWNPANRENIPTMDYDTETMEYLESVDFLIENNEVVGHCHLAYENEDASEVYRFEPITAGTYGYHNSFYFSCRVDTDYVGHVTLGVKNHGRGYSSLSQEVKFFDGTGEARSFTLAPAIHSITPTSGYHEGGTRVTINGRGLAAPNAGGEKAEVTVGGVACDIISANPRQIICDTRASVAIAEGAKHIGGAGANLEIVTGVGWTVDTDQFRNGADWYEGTEGDEERSKFSRRVYKAHTTKDFYQEWDAPWYGSRYHERSDWYFGQMNAAFVPPITGYYTLYKFCDDVGSMWMNTDGGNHPDTQEHLFSNIRTYNPSNAGPNTGESASARMFLEADKSYIFNDVFVEHAGRSYNKLSFIYHGPDAEINYEHDPVPARKSVDSYKVENDQLQIVQEVQEVEIHSASQDEHIKIALVSGDPDTIKFGLKWSNSNGQSKTTPLGTWTDHKADGGALTKTLIMSQCETIGTFDAFYMPSNEDASTQWKFPHGKTNVESFCGQKSYYARWREFFAIGDSEYLPAAEPVHIDIVPHFCFAHKGEFNVEHRHTHMFLEVGYMANGSSETFGEIIDNLSFLEMSFTAQEVGITSKTSWEHMCIDLRTMIFANEEMTSNQNPDFVEHVYLRRLYFRDRWGYFDEIGFGVASDDYEVFRSDVPIRPNTPVGNIDMKINENAMTAKLKNTLCGIDIPLMEVVAADSITVEVEDIVVFNNFNEETTAKLYTLTNQWGAQLQISVHEHQPVSPGVQGFFQLSYLGQTTPDIDIQSPDINDVLTSELKKLHGDVAMVNAEANGNCNDGYTLELWWEAPGDFAPIQVQNINLTGVELSVQTVDVRSGGVWIKEIPGAFLRTVHDEPQVVVSRKGISAACNTNDQDCSFSYLDSPADIISTSAAQVNTPSSGESSFVINFDAAVTIAYVKVGDEFPEFCLENTQCRFVQNEKTSVEVFFQSLPYGDHKITAYTEFGALLNTNDHRITVNPPASGVTVVPTSGPTYGGNMVTISGKGVGIGEQIPLFDGIASKVISVSADEIVCLSPTIENTGAPVDISFDNSVVLGSFSYAGASYDITPSRVDWSVKGNQEIIFDLSASPADLEFGDLFFGDDWIATLNFANDALVYLSAPSDAKSDIAVRICLFKKVDGETVYLGWTSTTLISYRLTIDSITPNESSTAGGRILTINGRGFGTNADDIQVEIGNIPCDVESASWQEITCKTRARYETHNVVLAGYSWFPQRLTVRANDRITWSWISGEQFTVQIGTTDSLNNEEKLSDEIVSNIVSGTSGTVETVVTAAPGVYYYTSGYIDGYSIYANGQIEVLPARNYEDEVVLKLAGFKANTNPSLVRGWRKWKGNTDCATDGGFVTISSSETVPASCSECATHTYSYDLTPKASSVEFDGQTLTIHSDDFADQTDCPGAFDIVGRSAHGEIKFNIDSVSATEVTASLPPFKANWPFGEDLQIEVSEFGRGNVLINSHQVEKFTVSPRIDSVSPRIGSTEGGALVTLTGDGLKFDRYVYTKVSCCSEIISHTKTEIVCISSFGKPGSSAGIGISWYEKEPEDPSITLVLAGTLGGSYTMKTGFEFDFTEIPVEDDVSGFVHQSNDFTLDVSYQFPTTPVNLRAFMLGDDDVEIELTNTYLDLCEGKACFRSQWHATGYTTQVYTVRLVSENYGTITYGKVWPQIAVTSMQYSEGSQMGGHKIRLTTTTIHGELPAGQSVLFRRWGRNLCESGYQTPIPGVCTIKKISDTQIEIVSPAMHGDITGEGDRAGVNVVFDHDDDTESMIYFLDSVSNNYAYDWTLTPGVQSVSSNVLSIGDTLSITMNGTEDGTCTGLEVFIGEAPATVSSCDEAAGTVDVIVGPQGDGDYALKIFNPEVGWATIADGVNKVFTMKFDVTSITPSTGSYGGGVLVTLTGSGLGADTFDGRLCGESLYDCAFPDFETAICRTPNIGVREHDTFVCTYEFYNADGLPHGQSRMASFGFTFQLSDTAIISDISPVLGGSMGGTRITISGSGFVPLGQTVTIGQSACDIISETTTEIVCETNSHPTSSKEDVVVEITSAGFAARDPNAPASFTGKFWYIDRWSSIFTWGCTESPCENKPVDYDIAVIPAGTTVLLDESTPLLSVLLIQGGTLLWDRSSGIKLRAQYVLITDEGRFELGTEEDPFCLDENGDRMTADIELFGHSRSVKLPIYGAKVFAVRSGTLDLHGCPIGKSYSVISQTAHAGDSELVLKDVVETADGAASNWQAGDEIAIATTGGRLSLKQTERKVIQSVSGNTVTLTTPLEYRHIYHLSTWDGDELEVTAEVALLSRNVRLYGNRNMDWYEELPECTETQEADEKATQTCFRNKWGDEVGSDEFGSHLIMHYIVRGRIRNIEVFHAGQGAQLGRYALHFHNSGNQPDSYIASNSIHDTFNRAVTMHGVWNATIEWNVAFRCKGHNFFIEDAVEEDLLIQYNLAMMVKPAQSLLNTDQKATGFWITNTFNTIQHNRVAGSAQMGFWVNAPSVSGHANADCPPIVRSHCPIFTPTKTWYNNTGHDIGLYGFWVFTTEESVAYAPSTVDCQETWPPGEAIFEKGTFWNCKRGMEFAKVGDNVKVKDFTTANCELGGLSILETKSLRDGGMYDEYFTGIVDSKTIGYIDATIPELSLCTRFGVETPWKPDGQMTVDGIKFFNFDVSYEDDENVEPGWCSAIDACYSSYKFDCGRTSTWANVEWFNSPRKFAADWEHETILVDMDGSLTGMGAPGYSVVPQSALFPPSMCFDAPEFSVEFPAMICNSIEYNRYAVNQVLPDSLRGFSMIIQNRWGTSFVPFRKSRSTSPFGYMGLLLSGEHHDISWQDHEHITNITYSGQLFDIGKDKMVTIRHPFYQSTDYAEITGNKRGVHQNHSDFGDIFEDFVGEEKTDEIFDRDGSPLDYFISPIDHSLTFGAMRGDYSNKYYDLNFQISVYKCFWPGCVPPTEPPPTTPPTISDYCNWSDPACWDDGVVPADGANVTIANDKDVTLDIDITVDILFIEGTLRVSNVSDVMINARVVLVNTGMGSSQATRNLIAVENGNFFVGSEDSPICGTSVTINLTGNEFGAEFGAPAGAVPIGSKAIGNLGGLKLFGCPRDLRSSRLAADLVAGDNQLTLADDASSLQLGDELGIAPTSFDMREAESVVVTGVSGSVVTFDPPAHFDHLGNADFAGEVVVLTRNVKISGASDSSDFFGGRIVSMDVSESSTFRSGWAQVSDVEFVNMGQFGHTQPEDLRVPLAFYYVGLQDSSDERRSFVTNSAFHHSYNGGVVTGAGSDGVQVEGNVFFNIVADGIEDRGENTRIVDNTIIFCQYRVLYRSLYELQINLNNDAEQSNLPAGINTIGTRSSIVLNNRVSGVEGYCYKSHGKACSSNDLCSDTASENIQSPPVIENHGHTCMFGAAIIQETGRPCMEYSNFNLWKIMDFAFYTQAIGSDVHIKNNIITDVVTGIQNVMIGNGDPLDHVHGDQKVSIDGNVFTGFSDHFACSDYSKRSNALIVTSEMTSLSRARFNPRLGTTAIKIPYFQNKKNKWPKKHLDQQTGYTTLGGRSCAIGNTFINYKNQECGSRRSHVIVSTTKTLTDHAPVFEIRETTKTTSTKANAVFFHRPSISEVSLNTCVDMPCDGDRRRLVKDIDGSLINDAATGQEVAVIAQSEFHWEGVGGFSWSDNVDQRFGLGDYRIPTSMLTDKDGNVEDPYVYAPNRGISRPDSCEYQTSYNGYICSGANRGFLAFESMDFDTEVRRIAPIGIRSSSGFLDLGNGPSDTSCCAGYSCSLRITNNWFVVNCGETYDFHTTGTMPTKVRFSLQQLPSTCKIGVKMHTMRQNRQDVFLNGDNIIYSNQYDFANDTWRFPHPSMIPTLDEPSGSNYFDRAEQMLHFTLGGGDQLEVRIANSIILTLDITTEMSIEEFYASSNLPYLLAAMLGLDPSQVKIVQVVRETNPSRTWTHEHTTVSRQLPENSEVIRVQVEFSNEFGSEEEDSSSSDSGFGRLSFSSSAINNKNVGNRLVAAQMEGRLEADISQASGGDLGIVATTLTAQALSGETPAWYEKGTDGESQTVLSQLGIDPDILEGPALDDLIVETALLNNKTDLINSTNVEEQALLQETMDRTTKAVSYDQVPTTMVVVQQIPQKVFVGSRMRYPIKVAMLDADSQSMTEVGYMGDPMRITISSSPDTELTGTEAYFVPGNGIASFDFLQFAEAGRYSFTVSLSYTGEADIVVDDVMTISFEVTADVPSDLAFDVQPPTTVVQRRPFSSAIVMYDSAGNLMTGDILTASDPWRVCARPVNASSGQELLGDVEVPFVNGIAHFENLQFKEIEKNVAVRFFVCYAAGADVDALGVTQVISETMSVTNIDECESALHNCDPNASCTDTEGSYECACNDGFTGNGFVCIEFVNECEDDTHECSEYATCNDAPVGYTCACDTGFSGDGYECEDDDECLDGTDWCDAEISACINELGTFSCNCNSGYESVDAKRCRDIDECIAEPCSGENQQCTNTPGSYECACGEGFKLNWRDECVDINECNTGDHVCGENTQCENQLGSYTCVGTGGGGACTATCNAGYECGFDAAGEETCVDVDECADPALNNCQSFETCVNTVGKFRCDFDTDANCPADRPWKPEWKGRKNMRYIYMSDKEAMLAMKYKAKNRNVNPRTELYYGFVLFTKDVCGIDFLRAINDGRVQIGFVDSEPIYEHKITYYRNDKKNSNAGFSFRLTEVVDRDTPWSRKAGQIVKNMNADDVQIIFMGLDKVNWHTNAETCLLTAANAIMPDGDYPDIMTPCVLWEKTFWSTPSL